MKARNTEDPEQVLEYVNQLCFLLIAHTFSKFGSHCLGRPYTNYSLTRNINRYNGMYVHHVYNI
jgi:hypothetical protein